MNLFYTKRQNIGDQIFMGGRDGLEAAKGRPGLPEKTGGPNAFVNVLRAGLRSARGRCGLLGVSFFARRTALAPMLLRAGTGVGPLVPGRYGARLAGGPRPRPAARSRS